MIILVPSEYYVKVKMINIDDLNIEDRCLDYNIDWYRESTGNSDGTSDKYKSIIDLEDVYKRNFFDELDNEYAKNSVMQNKTMKE